jgi:hypothetical protein
LETTVTDYEFNIYKSWVCLKKFNKQEVNIRRMSSSGMWRRVDLAITDVSEERIASIFMVEKSASEEHQREHVAADCGDQNHNGWQH